MSCHHVRACSEVMRRGFFKGGNSIFRGRVWQLHHPQITSKRELCRLAAFDGGIVQSRLFRDRQLSVRLTISVARNNGGGLKARPVSAVGKSAFWAPTPRRLFYAFCKRQILIMLILRDVLDLNTCGGQRYPCVAKKRY